MMQVSFLFKHSPFQSKLASEGLDMALAFAAFEQKVRLIFADDGVYQLLPQQGALIGQKNLQQRLQAAELYDITEVYVCAKALEARNINPKQLADISGLAVVSDIFEVLNDSESVMSF